MSWWAWLIIAFTVSGAAWGLWIRWECKKAVPEPVTTGREKDGEPLSEDEKAAWTLAKVAFDLPASEFGEWVEETLLAEIADGIEKDEGGETL